MLMGKPYLENLQFVAMMTDTLQYLLDVFHKSVVENWFAEFDMSEMALALSSLPACFAFLVHGAHSESEIVGT